MANTPRSTVQCTSEPRLRVLVEVAIDGTIKPDGVDPVRDRLVDAACTC